MDVSIPLYTAGTALMVPWPEEESRLLAPIYPFQPTVTFYNDIVQKFTPIWYDILSSIGLVDTSGGDGSRGFYSNLVTGHLRQILWCRHHQQRF